MSAGLSTRYVTRLAAMESRKPIMRSTGIAAVALLALAGGCATTRPHDREWSGAEMYQRFCASCHGANAGGDGPVAPRIKGGVPDLTHIASRHGGQFPADEVHRTIDGRLERPAHGSRNMPVWGWEFYNHASPNYDKEDMRVDAMVGRLVDYLRSVQVQ